MRNLYLTTIIAFTILFSYSINAIAQLDFSRDPEAVYQYPREEAVRKHVEEWQQLKFGLFLHWGTYSQWGIVESWSLCPEDRHFTQRTGPYAHDWYLYKKEYENLQTVFNPVKFDPRKWANAAEAAGMRYMVFTTKHHDGFCMYDSKYTDYKITDPRSPFSSNPNADITRAVFDTFRNKGFTVGAYFSKPDWHSQDYWWSYFPPKDRNESYDRAKYPERWKRFTEFTYNQLEELVTNYGKVDLLWFDGNWANMDMTDIVNMARRHQEDIMIVDRYGEPEYVNYLTPEQKIPEHYIPHPWETCMTMGESWSYVEDENFKSTRELIRILVDIVAKNGNLLLGVGPGPDGEFHDEVYTRLREIGEWMTINSEAIHGTKPVAPYRDGAWGFTSKGNNVYATYLPEVNETRLPSEVVVPVSILNGQKSVRLLATGDRLLWTREGDNIRIRIPANVRNKCADSPAWVFKFQK